MRYRRLTTVLSTATALSGQNCLRRLALAMAVSALSLLLAGCVASRRATSEHIRVGRTEQKDCLRTERLAVAVHDTIVEVTTITIRENEAGDTLRMAQITERTRTSVRDRVSDQRERVAVRTDTVYIEKRDSVEVKESRTNMLERVLLVVVGLVVLVIIIKVNKC